VTRNMGEGDQTRPHLARRSGSRSRPNFPAAARQMREAPWRGNAGRRQEHIPAHRARSRTVSMSRRFPEFSRMFWQSIRPQPGLHPAMRARMWKPGQSGNPAGVSKAYAEAMREISMRPVELSSGAERTRRWRERRRQGVVVVSFDVAPDVTARLIRSGWLDATKRGDKEAIATALIELAEKATELEVTSASRSM
jgi:hypothetical protein